MDIAGSILSLQEVLDMEETVQNAEPEVVNEAAATCVGSSAEHVASSLSAPSAPAAPTPRPAKTKAKLLTGHEKLKVVEKLANIESSILEAEVMRCVLGELHIKVFPGRASSLEKFPRVWKRVIVRLAEKFAQVHRETSTKANKYAIFQMMWTTALRSEMDHPDVCALDLSDYDCTSVVMSIGAAVSNFCCRVVKEHLQTAIEDEPGVAVALEDKHAHRFFGWALHSCIAGLKGKQHRDGSTLRTMETECLDLCRLLRLKRDEKAEANIPTSLTVRDKGWMTFMRPEVISFAEKSLDKIYGVVNQQAYRTYGKDMVIVASTALEHDRTIVGPLQECVSAMFPGKFSGDVVKTVARKLIDKVFHAVCQEVIDSVEQMQITSAGRTTTRGLNLRDRIHV